MMIRKLHRRRKVKEVTRTRDIQEKFASAKTIDINASEFRILGSLGEGGFACVFRYGSSLKQLLK